MGESPTLSATDFRQRKSPSKSGGSKIAGQEQCSTVVWHSPSVNKWLNRAFDQIVPAPKPSKSSAKSRATSPAGAEAKPAKKTAEGIAAEVDEVANALKQDVADLPDEKANDDKPPEADHVDDRPPPYIVDDAEIDEIGPGKSEYDPTLMAVVRNMDGEIDRQRILAKIPDRVRQLAFSLHMDREPQEVIARACGVSTRTIRTWIAEIQEDLQQTKEAQELLIRRAGAKS